MRTSTLSALSALFAGLTLAHPVNVSKRGSRFSEVDITILQFALTLEHLENTFYQEAFNSFQLQDFIDAGFSEEFFLNLQFIAEDESTHVSVLEAAIESAGIAPVLPCQYNFPVNDVVSFVTLSAVLESVGTSAYLGAAPFVESKDLLGVAASIMVTEALHTSQQRTSIGAIGASDPFGTSLDANSVFTLASQFIVSCPPSNPPLPFTPFPGLAVKAQQCFNENNFGSSAIESAVYASETTTADYSTITYDSSADDTATDTWAAAISTTDSAAASSTDYSSTATATSAPAYLRARTDSNSSSSYDSVETVSAKYAESTSTTTTDYAAASSTSSISSDYEESGSSSRSGSSSSSSSDSSSISCNAPSSGSQIHLTPDFSSSRRDFSRIEEIFVTFVEGLNIISIAVQINQNSIRNGMDVKIPSGIGGQVYIFITIIDISGKSFSDKDVLFGPAILEVTPSLPSLGI